MKYKYHKGSAIDFVDAPDWANKRIKGDNDMHHSFIGELGGTELVTSVEGADGWWEFNKGFSYAIIAHRELIPEESGSVTITNNSIDNITINNSTDQLITERGSRYGKFKDGAEIMQSLKDTMRDVDGWNNLTASQKEALDMIQHKIGRILNGDPTYDDSWKDIAGYATLIVNELNGEVR